MICLRIPVIHNQIIPSLNYKPHLLFDNQCVYVVDIYPYPDYIMNVKYSVFDYNFPLLGN